MWKLNSSTNEKREWNVLRSHVLKWLFSPSGFRRVSRSWTCVTVGPLTQSLTLSIRTPFISPDLRSPPPLPQAFLWRTATFPSTVRWEAVFLKLLSGEPSPSHFYAQLLCLLFHSFFELFSKQGPVGTVCVASWNSSRTRERSVWVHWIIPICPPSVSSYNSRCVNNMLLTMKRDMFLVDFIFIVLYIYLICAAFSRCQETIGCSVT